MNYNVILTCAVTGGSDMISAAERVAHIEKIKPEICSLDCGSFNYAATAYVATMDMLRESAARIRRAGVKPELEVFELGHIWQAKQLMTENIVEEAQPYLVPIHK
jgi:uncharacterized protein (DUF849 family)